MAQKPTIGALQKRVNELEGEVERLTSELQKIKTQSKGTPIINISKDEQANSIELNEARRLLADSQKKYHDLVNFLPQTIFETDRNGTFTFINRYAEIEFGYSKEEAVGKLHYTETVIPKYRPYVIKALEDFSQNIGDGLEFVMLRKDGTTFTGLIHYAPIIIDDDFIGLRGIITNINYQKENEERYRLLIENQNDLVVKVDKNGDFIYVSPSYCKYFGKSEKELLGKSFYPLVHENDRASTASTMESLYKEPYSCYLEQRVSTANGWRWLAWSDKAILNDKGEVVEIIGVGRDITDRKIIEKALQESEENYRTIFELANDSIMIHDPEDLTIVNANKNAISSYGLNTLDELRKHGFFSETPYSQKEAGEFIAKALSKGLQVFEWKNIRIDGSVFWEEVCLSPISIQGKDYVLSIARDITVRKSVEERLQKINKELKLRNEEYAALNEEYATQNEELQEAKERAEEADRLKSAFLANMSHEIRTPMNAIMGFSTLLSKANISNEKQKHYASIIRSRSNDLLKIIDDILDISKIEANQLVLQETSHNINTLLDNILDYALSKIEVENNPKISVSLVNQIVDKENINVDSGRLKQVLYNLLENALKFTLSGEIEIGCKDGKKGNLLFYVKDTGVGIPFEKQEAIFDRFTQVHDSERHNNTGTGLGLAISKGIVELMGGQIWVESQVGEGSTFYFTIPYKKGNVVADKGFDYERKVGGIKDGILIVEDDGSNASFLQEVLSQTNAPLWLATTGGEALKMLSSIPEIQIILLDIGLPDYNGLDIIKQFRVISPNVKIIAQSAYATAEDKLLGYQAGCDGYITKPINEDELLEILIRKTEGEE
ncbi:MAG: PAS domain S-box protein [Bacteroidales bacterium]